MKNVFTYTLIVSVALTVFSCNKSQDVTPTEGPVPTLPVLQAGDIPADPNNMDVTTYFDVDAGEITAGPDNTIWDVAFKGTTVYINGGTSGPGQGQAQIVNGIFSELVTAPTDGYKYDDEGNTGLAIPTGSGNGWYNYDFMTHIISPIPGVIIAFKTANGNYAKMEILSYYEGNPDLQGLNEAPPGERHYTINYVVQENGTTNF